MEQRSTPVWVPHLDKTQYCMFSIVSIYPTNILFIYQSIHPSMDLSIQQTTKQILKHFTHFILLLILPNTMVMKRSSIPASNSMGGMKIVPAAKHTSRPNVNELIKNSFEFLPCMSTFSVLFLFYSAIEVVVHAHVQHYVNCNITILLLWILPISEKNNR